MIPSYTPLPSFPRMDTIMPPKDDRTPTQANFAYQIHQQMLPDQQLPHIPLSSSPTSYPQYGAASNAHDLATIPQYDPSSISQTPQPSYQVYHALPLQLVAHTLPSDPVLVSSLPSSQGSESHYYGELQYHPSQVASTSSMNTSNDTVNPVQWDQNNNDDSLYASALDNTTSQFATAAPFNDFLGLSSDFPITPLSRMIFEHDKRANGSSSEDYEDLQDSFIASLEAPSYWAESVQEAFDSGSGWNVPN